VRLLYQKTFISLASAFIVQSIIIAFFFRSSCSIACDIAVVSAKVSSDGKPFIWKNRDFSLSMNEQVMFFKGAYPHVGGYIIVYNFDEQMYWNTGIKNNPSGGLNEAGFAIANAAAYETVFWNEIINIDTDIIRKALIECITIDDFEKLLKNWHINNDDRAISSNFVVIDAYGGAALYECWTGFVPTFNNRMLYEKFDANTAVAEDTGKFLGFINRTNDNQHMNSGNGKERKQRAYKLMYDLKSQNRLNYQTVMQIVAKDVVAGKTRNYNPGSMNNYSTTYCISRAQTRLGMVATSVSAGSDSRLSTFWCNLGEPSIGVFTPYFPYTNDVSYYAWADQLNEAGEPVDESDASLLNIAISNRKTYDKLIYHSNEGSNSGMKDKKINKLELLKVQQWTYLIENMIIEEYKKYLVFMNDNPKDITKKKFKEFSDYCAQYAYVNYTHGSADFVEWTFDTHSTLLSGESTDIITDNPVVRSTSPRDSDEYVPVDERITITFSKPMNYSLISSSTFSLYDGFSYIDGQVIYNDSTNTAIFIPKENLAYATVYTATISKNIEDWAGNPKGEDHILSFTTSPIWFKRFYDTYGEIPPVVPNGR